MRELTAAMSEILAANIRTLRKSTGLNQTEFGELIGVSQATVARWETGAEPKSALLIKLVSKAGCTISEFTSGLWTAPAERRSPPPEFHSSGGAIYLPVMLPSEAALAEMFESLLEIVGPDGELADDARQLAQLLPSALAQTVARQTATQLATDEPPILSSDDQPQSTDNRGQPPQRRT